MPIVLQCRLYSLLTFFNSTIGQTYQKEMLNFLSGDGTPRFSPFFIPKLIADITAGRISMKYGFRGPNFATVSACASSTNALIDAWPDAGRIDFVNSFSVPFPVGVIASTLNMAPEAVAHIKRWSDASVAALGVALDDDARVEAARAVVEAHQYWVKEFESRRANPRDDFLTELTQAIFELEGTLDKYQQSNRPKHTGSVKTPAEKQSGKHS